MCVCMCVASVFLSPPQIEIESKSDEFLNNCVNVCVCVCACMCVCVHVCERCAGGTDDPRRAR